MQGTYRILGKTKAGTNCTGCGEHGGLFEESAAKFLCVLSGFCRNFQKSRLAFHRCDKARKLKKLKRLNKLNQRGKAIYTETIAAPSTAFELGSSHARNAPDGTQNCLILRSASRTNRVIRLFEEFDAEFNICRAVFFTRASS